MTHVVIVVFLAIFASMASAAEWDRELAKPPEMSAAMIAEAKIELLPENVDKTKTALVSEYFKEKMEEKSSNELYAQVLLTYRMSANKEVARSLFGKQLYVEKPLSGSGKISVFGVLYHNQEFRSAYAGVAEKFGDIQVAISVGLAQYNEINHLTINPWVYYDKNGVNGFLTAEHYSREKKAPWYYKGYMYKNFSELFFAGVYGETDFGIGPMIGWVFNKKIKAWVAIPITHQPEESRAHMTFGLSVEF